MNQPKKFWFFRSIGLKSFFFRSYLQFFSIKKVLEINSVPTHVDIETCDGSPKVLIDLFFQSFNLKIPTGVGNFD